MSESITTKIKNLETKSGKLYKRKFLLWQRQQRKHSPALFKFKCEGNTKKFEKNNQGGSERRIQRNLDKKARQNNVIIYGVADIDFTNKEEEDKWNGEFAENLFKDRKASVSQRSQLNLSDISKMKNFDHSYSLFLGKR